MFIVAARQVFEKDLIMPHEGKISLKKTFHDTLTRTGMGFATKNYLLLNLMIQSLFSPMYSLNIEIYTNCGRCNLKCTGTWDRNPRIVDDILHPLLLYCVFLFWYLFKDATLPKNLVFPIMKLVFILSLE